MVGVRACSRESHSPVSQAACLALDAEKAPTIVDGQVRPSVLAERHIDAIAAISESEHDRQCRTIANVLRVLHPDSLAAASDGPCPK